MKLATLLLSAVLLLDWNSAAKIRLSARRNVRWTVRWHNLTDCPDKGSPTQILNYSVHRDRSGQEYIDGSLMVKGAQRISKLVTHLTRCRDTGTASYDNCEHLEPLQWRVGLCDLIAAPGMPWSSPLDSVFPRLRCPVRKGLYRLSNLTLDVDIMVRMWQGEHLRGYIFQSESTAYDEHNDIFLCLNLVHEMKQTTRRP